MGKKKTKYCRYQARAGGSITFYFKRQFKFPSSNDQKILYETRKDSKEKSAIYKINRFICVTKSLSFK